uniref:Putative single-stranded DNA-binding protein n=1 Tax=viral metagenome TaxID=1070528 RepID=A0A6M3IG23_9ZZZZ
MIFNRVFAFARLARDPESKFTPQGTCVVNMRCCVPDGYFDANQKWIDTPVWVDVVAMGPTAERIESRKGDAVLIEGKLKYEEWEAKDGKKRNKIAIWASKVMRVPKADPSWERAPANDSGEDTGEHEAHDEEQDNLPF